MGSAAVLMKRQAAELLNIAKSLGNEELYDLALKIQESAEKVPKEFEVLFSKHLVFTEVTAACRVDEVLESRVSVSAARALDLLPADDWIELSKRPVREAAKFLLQNF